ncbi:tetratricopeptide repeat protein, partial [Actinomyces naeslundii]|uniref:tetratricopeptide repeat protein n=1 Tax=Actinomyces naeslundii TaxID=1655 RepID=UPI00097B1B3A
AVDLYRELAQTSPAAYTPNLAGALNNLATILSEVGRSGETLEVAQEAVDLYRELAQTSPAAYTPNLAGALNNLATILSEVGRS